MLKLVDTGSAFWSQKTTGFLSQQALLACPKNSRLSEGCNTMTFKSQIDPSSEFLLS
jgi:hypothetical protein